VPCEDLEWRALRLWDSYSGSDRYAVQIMPEF